MEEMTSLEDIKIILARTAKITEQNAKLIGDLGNKFGSFTEGMAFPSMKNVLQKQFGMTTIATRYTSHRNGNTLEIDVLGWANGDSNTAVVVEVKSHLKPRDIDQTLSILNRFADYFPEHKTKKLYGIIAFVDASNEVIQLAEKAGLFVAHIHDELFTLLPTNGFLPKDFSQPAVTN